MSLILSGTDGLSDVDGSAATPAIRGTDANTGIFFGTDIIGFSEGGVEAMRINASGNLQTIGTIGVGAATPSASGAGITFPATASLSSDVNTLDDYEEGTFTPTLIASSTNFSSVTYGTSFGTYTKIGNLVTVSINLVWTAISGGNGIIFVGGLPFTYTATSGYGGGGAMGYASGLSTNGMTYMDGGTARFVLVKAGGNGQTYFQAGTADITTGQIMLGGSYRTDS